MTASVLVGATGEIGRVIADRLVTAGHEVVAVARGEAALVDLAASRPAITVCPADVTAPDAGERVRAALAGRRVRMLVHAASAPLGGSVLSTPAEVVRRSLEVKVVALLALVRALAPDFDDDARVVAVGGNLAFDPVPGACTAGIANAAQANAVRQLNRALAPRGVTCHVVAPGPVLTGRYRGLAADEARRRGVDVEQVVAEAVAAAPLGRLTTPEEVAWAVVLLAQPEAAALAGSTLLIDAGRRTAIP